MEVTQIKRTTKLKSIKTVKSEDVYDISVEKNHNFVANGIVVHNCVEIGMYPVLSENGTHISGIQGCNLTEQNAAMINSVEDFILSCRCAAILGTLQAGYTNFPYLGEVSEKIFKREALLGCSITGWMDKPDILFDKDTLRMGADVIKSVNDEVASLIGINPAARRTCVKPSGNASTLLKTSSGIHPQHSRRYLRMAQLNKELEVSQLILDKNPYMVEDSESSANRTDFSIAFPVIVDDNAIIKDDLSAIDFLEKVKFVQQTWVEYGTSPERCIDPNLRHNVSNTITVGENDSWKEIGEYLFENKDLFSGVALMGGYGDKDFYQAPFTKVLTEEEILKEYGTAGFFASGLIVDTHKGFDNLWQAFNVVQFGSSEGGEKHDLQADWVRRFKKFANNYFDGDLQKTAYCMKDVYLLHRWTKIQQNLVNIDYANELKTKKYTDVDTMGSIACVGPNGCEINI